MTSSSPIFEYHSCPQKVLLGQRTARSVHLENNTENFQHSCTIYISAQYNLHLLLNSTTKIEFLTEIKHLTNAKSLTKIKHLAKMKFLTKINNLIKINCLIKINNFTKINVFLRLNM